MPKPSVDSLKLNLNDWRELERSEHHVRWLRGPGTSEVPQQLMTLRFFDVAPTLPCGLDNRDLLLASHCMFAGATAGGALIDFNIIEAAGFPAIYYVSKLPDARREHGIHVTGSLTIPFETCYYTVQIEMPEGNTTGMREAIILDQLLQAQEVEIDSATNELRGWVVDQEFMPNTLRANRGDDPVFDQFFPEHPLTMVRNLLNVVVATCTIDPALSGTLRPFA